MEFSRPQRWRQPPISLLIGAVIGGSIVFLLEPHATEAPQGLADTQFETLNTHLALLEQQISQLQNSRAEVNPRVTDTHVRPENTPAPPTQSTVTTSAPASGATANIAERAALEDAIVSGILERVQASAYSGSAPLTLPQVLNLPEMSELSDANRERVVSEIVSMMNTGKLPAHQFFSDSK